MENYQSKDQEYWTDYWNQLTSKNTCRAGKEIHTLQKWMKNGANVIKVNECFNRPAGYSSRYPAVSIHSQAWVVIWYNYYYYNEMRKTYKNCGFWWENLQFLWIMWFWWENLTKIVDLGNTGEKNLRFLQIQDNDVFVWSNGYSNTKKRLLRAINPSYK